MQINRLKYSIEFYKECAKYLNEGHSLKEASENFDINYTTLRQNLVKLGLRKPNRKINQNVSFNENYFDNIDTSEKAYFLGFLMADGYICKNAYSSEIGIALQSSDSYILEKFKSEIESTNKIYHYKNSEKIVLKGSEHLFNTLQSYGFLEDKSHKDYIVPPQIPDNLIHDFVRGYFDGDGCISIKATGYITISICCNSEQFLISLKNILENKFKIPNIKLNCETTGRKNPLYVIYITTKENQKLFKEFIYQNDTELKLLRKYEKFRAIPR